MPGVQRRDMVRLSKRISLALRHAPGRFGLVLDEAGWVEVEDLLAALRITRADLDAVVAGNDKQRVVAGAWVSTRRASVPGTLEKGTGRRSVGT